jgi:hypothetical protein
MHNAMFNAIHRQGAIERAIGPQLVIRLARIEQGRPTTDAKTVLLPMHCSPSHFPSFRSKMGGESGKQDAYPAGQPRRWRRWQDRPPQATAGVAHPLGRNQIWPNRKIGVTNGGSHTTY